MNNLRKLSQILVIGLTLAAASWAQLTTPSTTLSVAIPATATTQWCLASATGVVLPSLSGAVQGSYLFIDKEAAQVKSQGYSSTCFIVTRGQLGTAGNVGHAAGATVWIGNVASGTGDTSRPFSGGVLTNVIPSGTCVAASQYSLPVIIYGANNNPYAGNIASCVGGVWTVGQPQFGSGAYPYGVFSTLSPMSGVAGASVSYVVGTEFWSQINAESTAKLTGACLRNGATVGTSKVIYFLADSAGNIIANTTTAGTTTSGANVYQCIAFTSPVWVFGDQTYFIGVQGDNVTDNFLAYAASSAPPLYGTNSQTGSFGTLAKITPTLTFNASKGPIMMTY